MSKFAVVETGSKQYKVAEGEVFDVETIEGKTGANVTLDQVLLIVDGDKVNVGSPTVERVAVTAEIIEQRRDAKVVVFHYKAKKRSRSKTGHRQNKTRLKVTAIPSLK